MTVPAQHGGDVRGIARRYGRQADEFLDFSANINPLGPPRAVRELFARYGADASLTRYPEPHLPELAAALAERRGVRPENIVIHAGSAALFDTILRACAPRRLGICIPAFAEYARAARANAIGLHPFALDVRSDTPFDPERFADWVRIEAIDAVMLTNPHNPLGFALAAAAVRQLLARAPQTVFIIDEAFADYDESVSVALDAATNSQLIVVRSVTKFYAIPDLRVGYAVMTQQRADALAAYLPAWPVAGIAAAAAALAVADTGFAARSRADNEQQRALLAAGLRALDLRVLPGAANFLTFATRDVAARRERLIVEDSIVVRDCSSFAGLEADAYIRVAVREAGDNATLLRALRRVLAD